MRDLRNNEFSFKNESGMEISRQYAMFAAPVAYLIDDAGVIAADVAAGSDDILDLVRRSSSFILSLSGPFSSPNAH